MRGQNTRGRAIPAGFCNTPPYFGQSQQGPETRPEGPLTEDGRTLGISEHFRRLPATIVSKPGVTTSLIDGCVTQESLQPCPSTDRGNDDQRRGAAVLLSRQHHGRTTVDDSGPRYVWSSHAGSDR
ncbi:hypothetical protein MRX96_035226 [Rhipicephalus microplus]